MTHANPIGYADDLTQMYAIKKTQSAVNDEGLGKSYADGLPDEPSWQMDLFNGSLLAKYRKMALDWLEIDKHSIKSLICCEK